MKLLKKEMEQKCFISIFVLKQEVEKMELKQIDQIEETAQILNGLRDFCMIIENPAVKDVPETVFVVIGVALNRATLLIETVLEQELKKT